MDEFLRLLLPTYCFIYFLLAFVLKSLIIAKRIGKNPLVLPKDDSVLGLIGLYFKLTLVSVFIYVLVFAFCPTCNYMFLPIIWLDNLTLKYIGILLLAIALIWTTLAQAQMKNSWRIGIDMETKTELVTTGLFTISRNPIFLGMILSLIGLFLTTPNAFTGMFLIIGYILIQIQIRFEEDFLAKEHGQSYTNYKQKVRRLI